MIWGFVKNLRQMFQELGSKRVAERQFLGLDWERTPSYTLSLVGINNDLRFQMFQELVSKRSAERQLGLEWQYHKPKGAFEDKAQRRVCSFNIPFVTNG